MKKDQKITHLGACLIAPGVSQLLMRRWFSGGIMLIIAVFTVLWTCCEFVFAILLTLYEIILDTSSVAPLKNINWERITIAMVILGFVWLWSIVDTYIVLSRRNEQDQLKGEI